jgi:hypothetical protein
VFLVSGHDHHDHGYVYKVYTRTRDVFLKLLSSVLLKKSRPGPKVVVVVVGFVAGDDGLFWQSSCCHFENAVRCAKDLLHLLME